MPTSKSVATKIELVNSLFFFIEGNLSQVKHFFANDNFHCHCRKLLFAHLC